MKPLLLSIATFLTFSVIIAQKNDPYLLIGTYTNGKSEGIYVYTFNEQTGDATYKSFIKTQNPSFLAISPNRQYVYAVNEKEDSTRFTNEGHVAAFSFDKKDGTLHFLNKQSSGGVHPCYVTVDKTGKWVIAANYSSGTIGVVGIKKDGSLDTLHQKIEHYGYSVNSERQTGPHAHSAILSKDNRFLFTPDLGTDKIMIYRFNDKTGDAVEADYPFVQSEPGAGPRHFEFHPNGRNAYLIEEMNGTISAFSYVSKSGELSMIQTISALPPEYMKTIGSADIHISPDGKFLYATNRGESNTIGTFGINSQGLLHPIMHDSTMGKTPRNFNFDPTGNYVLVANQNSDNIVIFKRDKQSGLLADTGKRINVGNPVCLKWIVD